MSFTVFLGNLPAWVTADDVKAWLTAENLVADQIKVIRNPETQESKGFAFIEAPNSEEMQSIITRFDRAPLEDRLLRANPAQPPKGRRPAGAPTGDRPMGDRPPRDFRRSGPPQHGGGARRSTSTPDGAVAASTSNPPTSSSGAPPAPSNSGTAAAGGGETRRRERRGTGGPQSAFAEELAKAL